MKAVGGMIGSLDKPRQQIQNMPEARAPDDRLALAAMVRDIVVACLAQSPVKPEEIPRLIADVEAAMADVVRGTRRAQVNRPAPAVPIAESVQDDFLVCLEDGAKVKSLRTYLKRHHDLTPAQYIDRWGLPADYPMVAPSYSQARRDIARRHALGGSAPGKGRRETDRRR